MTFPSVRRFNEETLPSKTLAICVQAHMTSLKKNRQFYLTAKLETQGSKKEARARVGHLFKRYLDGPALQKPEGS